MPDYKDIKIRGNGTFGIVYESQDPDGYTVARKYFKDPGIVGVSREDLLKRFRREVKYQSGFSHPNVVEVFDADVECDQPWFSMELAKCSLKEMVDKGTLTTELRDQALFDILSGLEAIHTAGFKHRDLKPANVLFFDEVGGPRFAVSDFGLGAPQDSESSTLTATDATGGTLKYAAPELSKSLRLATFATDIYSFGAILHDFFVGGPRIPFAKQRGPGEIGKIIEKCTEPHTRRRYSSIKALRADLFDALMISGDTTTSAEDDRIISILGSEKPSQDDLDFVFLQLEDHISRRQFNRRVVSAFDPIVLKWIADRFPEYVSVLCEYLLEYNLDGQRAFRFEYCDVLADEMQQVYAYADDEGKALICLSLLILGTTHNRYYVEHMFLELCGPDADAGIVSRMLIEAEARNINFDKYVNHIPRSIHMSIEELHPLLRERIEDG